jgi:hypothetical protein
MEKIVPSKPLTLDLMETSDLFFRKVCYDQNASCRKMKRIKVVETLYIYKFGYVHFWYTIHPKKLRNLQKKVQSFHEVQKLEAFAVILDF